MNMSPVVHFEMPSENKKRTADFYSKVFGWQMRQLGPDMGDYLLASTADSDPKGISTKAGAINGGFFTKSKEHDVPGIVIQVDDIRAAMKKVDAAGGTVLGGHDSKEPDDMPGIGLFVAFRDPDGNVVTIMQPVRK